MKKDHSRNERRRNVRLARRPEKIHEVMVGKNTPKTGQNGTIWVNRFAGCFGRQPDAGLPKHKRLRPQKGL